MPVNECKGLRKKSRFFHRGDGYYYHKNRRLRPGVWSCRCSRWYSDNCRGRAIISEDLSHFEQTQPHNCHPDQFFWKVRALRRAILKRCRTRDPTSSVHIIEQESRGFEREVRRKNSAKILRSAIRRARVGVFGGVLPSDLTALDEILRSDKFKHLTKTEDGDYVYAGRCGSSGTRSRCLIFMSEAQRQLMAKAKNIFMDSTWDGRPKKPRSSQMLSITTKILDEVIPLCVVLMESKTKHSYQILLRSIKQLVPEFEPETINCDFEDAEYQSCKEEWPNAKVQGCLYHYSSNVSNYAKGLGFYNLIIEDPVFNSLVRSTLSIPLVPRARLDEALESIILRAHNEGYGDIIDGLLQYIYKEYIQKRGHVLSVYLAEDRTDNISECWNRMLQRVMGVPRPNVYIFLDGIVHAHDMFVQNFYNLVRGEKNTRGRKLSSVRNDIAILNFTRLLDGNIISMTDFLRRSSMRLLSPYRRVFPLPPAP